MMLLVFTLYYICTLCTYQVNAQCINCDLLTNAVNTDFFEKEFVTKNYDNSIIIYDKAKALKNCDNFKSKDLLVEVSNEKKYDLYPDTYSPDKPKNLIILISVKKENKKYILNLWRPYSGASLILTYKFKRGKAKVIKHEIGTF